MDHLFGAVARVVERRPALTIVAVIVASIAVGWFAPQAQMVDGVAVDNEESRALDALEEAFGDERTVVQVLVTADGGDVRTADGVRAAAAVEDAITLAPVGASLADGGQPPIVAFLTDARIGAQMRGIALEAIDDADVAGLRDAAAAALPPEVVGLFDALLSAGDPPSAGLVVVFLDTAGRSDAEILALQREVVDAVAAAEVPAGLTAEVVSIGLLLGDSDIGPEVGRLFGTALAVVLAVLAVVYWVRPVGGDRARLVRRTAADVGLTLVVIVLSVVWMQGVGVLLGPGFLGLIGAFSPQTQIVPILVVGLGVDFAIHFLARYRVAVAETRRPSVALTDTLPLIGPTLMLCTAATAVGFLTNLASPVDFLATLGVLAAVGISAAFGLTVTLLPAARVLLDERARRLGRLPAAALATGPRRGLPRTIGRTAWLAERAPRATLAVALVVVLAGGYGFSRLDTAFELTDFVPQDSPMLATFERLSTEFDGRFDERTDVLLQGDVAEAADGGALDDAIARLANVPGVVAFAGEVDATVAVADDGRIGRLSIATDVGQSGAAALAGGLAAALEPLEERGVAVTVTSPSIVQARIGEQIEDAQIVSLLIALLAAMALLAVHFGVTRRRPGLGVITVLPVVLVLAATFGTMALTGIPLNAVTATLAALSIGIGVPFTIHVTARYLEEAPRGGDALRRTVTQTGGALAGSALTTAIGFGVLVTSTLRPFEQLGYVIVYAIAYSFVAAVLVLPSLLALADARRDRRAGTTAGGDGQVRAVARV